MQASRPRSVISPVLFSVGVLVDHKVGATERIQILSRLGISISPDEIICYKQSVVQMNDDVLVKFYFEKLTDSLNYLQYNLQHVFLPNVFHILRVYLQVVQWKSLMDVQINPEEWGWEVKDGMYVPIGTDLPPAPAEILNVISCKCKTGCTSRLCTCRKHGLHCVAACKHCYGELCDNVEDIVPYGDVPWVNEEIVESETYYDI